MDSGLERPTTINTRTTFQSKNRAIKKEKGISRIKPKETLKVPSRRLESRIEKRKVARLIGGPVVRQSSCPLWWSAHTTAYEASGSSGTACELIKTRKIRFVRY